MKIVVPDDYPPVFSGSAAEPKLRALGDVSIFTERGAHEEAELIRRVGDADAVVNIRAHARYTAGVLASCPRLKLISIWGTGTDNVDLAAAQARGVKVMNTPGINAHAVAEHAMALILACVRHIVPQDAELKGGAWARSPLVQLEGKTLGIIGLGSTGTRLAALAAPFGVTLLATTMTPDGGRAAACGARWVPLDVLLRESDVVSLHLRLDERTRAILSRERIAVMKPTAFVVNTARGALIDRAALYDALARGMLAGAGLDVFHDEPVHDGDPILGLPNVVLTPHVAGMTPEVIAAGLMKTVQNVEAFLHA